MNDIVEVSVCLWSPFTCRELIFYFFKGRLLSSDELDPFRPSEHKLAVLKKKHKRLIKLPQYLTDDDSSPDLVQIPGL